MISLAKLSIRRPKAALAGWLVAGIALMLIGFGVSKTLSPSITVVSGTQSARAQKLADQAFGPSQLVPIMLEGPKAQLNRVGPRLVVALNKRAHTRLLSAWDAGTASAGLRPKPTAAMIVVSVDRSETDVVKYDQPQIERVVTRVIGSAPIKPYITGQPSIDRALRDASIDNLRRHGRKPDADRESRHATLLNALLLRPVLLPAAETVLGRFGWWPTHGPRAPKATRTAVTGRLPALHVPHGPRPQLPRRRPRSAHEGGVR